MNKLLLAAMLGCMVMAACKRPEATAPDTRPAAAPTSARTPAPTPAAADPGSGHPSASIEQVNQSIDRLLGDHTQYQAAIDALQKAVKAKDAAAVAALVSYPITVHVDGKRIEIKDEASFIANYDKLMTPAIAAAIVGTRYADLFVNYKGVMLGRGEAWLNGICTSGAKCEQFEVKVIAIQPT